MLTITIDSRQVHADEGNTILDVARREGIRIPTLCYLEGVQAIGACRLCVVEVEGAKTLMASCVTPVVDGMIIRTNTRRVRDARRTVMELLLSEHVGDCKTCSRSEDCELRKIAAELGIDTIEYQGATTNSVIDMSTPGILRDNGKCIKCRRCVAVCTQVQAVGAIFPQFRGFKTTIGPAFGKELADVPCVQCGQCAAVCPTGAIVEISHIDKVWNALEDKSKTVVVQTAPAVRASLGECFDLPPGTLVTGKMVTALRRLGFATVFDTNFSADLTIIEEGMELLSRLRKCVEGGEKVALPQFTSCSPGWVKYVEYFYPEFIPNVSTCKSPQQMFGAMAKTYWAEKIGKRAEDMFVVSIMPCHAKKFEAERPEMNDSGVQDVDAVLTTRELGKMIKEAGIDFVSLPDEEMDRILGVSSGAADIFANSGGVMEAALRTAWEVITGRELPFEKLHVVTLAGLKGIKEAEVEIKGTVPEWSFLEGVVLKVAVVSGLGNARSVLENIKSGAKTYHFVEVMTCPGGCVGGGGQPRITTDEVRQKRLDAIYREDEGKQLRKSHDNPKIKQLYGEFLGAPLGQKSHHLLHTTYVQREKV
ncbi:MAG: iron hydrogenase small subunit [Lentisphaerae bacterium]|nr:iron hydrogenase small subunit [Lentisphaerota bacterium]